LLFFNTLVVLTGAAILGAGCGVVGVFALLRRRALVGDVTAHAALPGLCLAFILVGHRNLPLLLFGAFLSGLAAVGVVALLSRVTRLGEDAILGIVLGGYFSTGVVLDSYIQGRIASASQSGMDSFFLGKTSGILLGDLVWAAGASVGCLLAALLLFKEWRLLAFDADFGVSQGWPMGLLEFLLLACIAIMTAVGLPMVGVVMMASMVILPAATARFWTERLSTMVGLSVVFGAWSAMAGVLLSANIEHAPAGPIIILVGGAVFFVSMLFAPRRGMYHRYRILADLKRHIEERLLLCSLYHVSNSAEVNRIIPTSVLNEIVVGPNRSRKQALAWAKAQGLLTPCAEGVLLTPEGWRAAVESARTERLWEAFSEHHPEQASLGIYTPESMDALRPELREQYIAQLSAQGRWPRIPESLAP
jgi:manganese/zinc/iron transport system permease protein